MYITTFTKQSTVYLAANNPNKATEVIQQSYLKPSEYEKWFKLQGEYNKSY